MKKVLFLFVLVTLATVSCNKEEDRPQSEIDQETIQQYISSHNLDAKSTGSGLYYVIDKQGSGKSAKSNSDVQVIYKGYLSNGQVFDENKDGLWINLNNVILGWQEGIPLFKEGGKGQLLIPSRLGYGPHKQGQIPASSVLIFDITLKDVR